MAWRAASRETVRHLPDAQIDKVTHGNAARDFSYDLFGRHRREALTVGALRARARAKGVDTAFRSRPGAAPLAKGEVRPVTSGDIVDMFKWRTEAA